MNRRDLLSALVITVLLPKGSKAANAGYTADTRHEKYAKTKSPVIGFIGN